MMGKCASTIVCWLLSALVTSAQQPPTNGATSDVYKIAANDVLSISVVGHSNLTGKYTVQPDGAVMMPLVGRVPSAGLTIPELEERVTRALADGYIKQPQVIVALDQFRGRQVFVFGAVNIPGPYVLTEHQTLIEVLAKAGYSNASEAVIMRPHKPQGPVTQPELAGEGDVIRVNLRELEKDVEQGTLARNVVLRDGDTIFVPRVDQTRVFVSGMVRNPGAYSITEGTTVLQALSLAGGPTEQAALNRLRIVRLVKGEQKTLKAKLTDVLLPGDTLLVPERFF